MARSYEELRKLSDDDLITAHDKIATSTDVGVNYYLDEIRRREATHQGDRLEAMTQRITQLTWVLAVLTAVTCVASVISTVIALTH